MDLVLTNLTTENGSKYSALVKDIIDKDFRELNGKYSSFKVITFRAELTSIEVVNKEVSDFMGEKAISLTGEDFAIRNTANPPKACLEINISMFEKFQDWKQRFAIRHELAHLSFNSKLSETLNRLISKYGLDKIRAFVRFQHEYIVHRLMIKRWEEDWLKEPVGFNESMPNPALAALNIRKTRGRREAMLFCIQNITHLLTLLKLYNIVSNHNRQVSKAKKIRLKKYRLSFYNALNVDSKNFPDPVDWFNEEDFCSEELYFQKIEELLLILDKA
jgi:hypothetical protein